jgi:hypothetical protein
MPLKTRRLLVWFAETASEALLIGFLLLFTPVLFTRGEGSFAGEVSLRFMSVLWFFFITGYLLTTAIIGIFWRSRRLWLYPSIAAVLFSIHLQIWFLGASGWTNAERLPYELAGPCIVFGCTFAGGRLLRKWEAALAPINS